MIDRITELQKVVDSKMKEMESIKTVAEKEQRHMNDDEKAKYEVLMVDVNAYLSDIDIEKKDTLLRNRIKESAKEPLRPDLSTIKEEKFDRFGEQLVAIMRASNPGLPFDRRLIRATGLNESTPSDGGFLVQTDFQSDIIKRIYETGILAGKCRKIPISANSNGIKLNAINETSRAEGSRFGGLTCYWLAEAGTKLSTKPEFRQMELSLKKLIGLYYATDELIQDASALESVVSQAIISELGYKVDKAIFRGTGAGQPLGILNSGSLVSVDKETGQLARTITYQNICDMWARLYSGSKRNAVWLINTDVLPQLFTMGLTLGVGGAPVYLPPGGASGSPYGSLFGRPVIEIEQASTLGTVGDISLVDLSEYVLIEKGGIQQASSIHIAFTTDETAFRFVYRVDGQPLWNSTLTPENVTGTKTLSPFVMLATRA